MNPAAVDALRALLLGFAFAGLMASCFELFTERRASFRLLRAGGVAAMVCVPVVVFCGPFIILRNMMHARQRLDGPAVQHFVFVMLATLFASLWSLMSGRVVLDLALRFIGH
ncbi:DUF6949 family protein [Chelatococcus albus]|nr:hypothetical protein [Chelatococcus sp. SYSU_G07232]